MTAQEVQQLADGFKAIGLFECWNLAVRVTDCGGGMLTLTGSFTAPDIDGTGPTGRIGDQLVISTSLNRDEVLLQLYMLTHALVLHELAESLTVHGVREFDPHK